jgi:hypothetical protein
MGTADQPEAAPGAVRRATAVVPELACEGCCASAQEAVYVAERLRGLLRSARVVVRPPGRALGPAAADWRVEVRLRAAPEGRSSLEQQQAEIESLLAGQGRSAPLVWKSLALSCGDAVAAGGHWSPELGQRERVIASLRCAPVDRAA